MTRLFFYLIIFLIIKEEKSFSALGESIESIMIDRKIFEPIKFYKEKKENYIVFYYESMFTIVKEYYSIQNDRIFCISWKSEEQIKLNKILGPYYTEYENHLDLSHHTQRNHHQYMKTENFVLERWGHMRNFSGKVYLPGYFPKNLDASDL